MVGCSDSTFNFVFCGTDNSYLILSFHFLTTSLYKRESYKLVRPSSNNTLP
ncbi:hypothetical protein AHF37_03400 [Paragonimus kellicotti]|nr:hypothetical protein AHF37_03400 [Paragonimus kellicotti]